MDPAMRAEVERLHPDRLDDFRVAMELKYLSRHCPSGVFMVPDKSNPKKLHGVVFVRQGFYKEGIFRFFVQLPSTYNAIGTTPAVKFTTSVYNPLVDPNVSSSSPLTVVLSYVCSERTSEHTPCVWNRHLVA